MATRTPTIYGLMAEFDDPNALVAAAHRAQLRGLPAHGRLLAVPGRGAARGARLHHNRLPLIVLIGGLVGCLGGYSCSTGRRRSTTRSTSAASRFNSWPAFIPVTFEMTVLVAALAAVLGMLALNGLPMPYHPVFNVPRFALASRNRFFLCIEARDPKFDLEGRASSSRRSGRGRCPTVAD